MFHRHALYKTGRQITAIFGKDNLPNKAAAVTSYGAELLCSCGARFIKHERGSPFAETITRLEDDQYKPRRPKTVPEGQELP